MSDTPRTDEAWELAQDVGEEVAWKLCRQLERENAALRAELDSWRYGNLYREEDLNELIQLRADKERLDWLGSVKCAYFHEGPCCWRINEDETTDAETIRAAIDAARKENG